jgi:hypothetical protein
MNADFQDLIFIHCRGCGELKDKISVQAPLAFPLSPESGEGGKKLIFTPTLSLPRRGGGDFFLCFNIFSLPLVGEGRVRGKIPNFSYLRG